MKLPKMVKAEAWEDVLEILDDIGKKWGCSDPERPRLYGFTYRWFNDACAFPQGVESKAKKRYLELYHLLREECEEGMFRKAEVLCFRRTAKGWYVGVHLVGECPYSDYIGKEDKE